MAVAPVKAIVYDPPPLVEMPSQPVTGDPPPGPVGPSTVVYERPLVG